MSGVTDCYQPAERRFSLTPGLLEVMLEARQATGIITKNALVTRDVDLLAQLAAMNLVQVRLSITTLDQELSRKLEPRQVVAGRQTRRRSHAERRRHSRRHHDRASSAGTQRSRDSKILAAAAEAGARRRLRPPTIAARREADLSPIGSQALPRQTRPRGGADSRHAQRRALSNGVQRATTRHRPLCRTDGEIVRRVRPRHRLSTNRCPEYDFSQFRPPHRQAGR